MDGTTAPKVEDLVDTPATIGEKVTDTLSKTLEKLSVSAKDPETKANPSKIFDVFGGMVGDIFDEVLPSPDPGSTKPNFASAFQELFSSLNQPQPPSNVAPKDRNEVQTILNNKLSRYQGILPVLEALIGDLPPKEEWDNVDDVRKEYSARVNEIGSTLEGLAHEFQTVAGMIVSSHLNKITGKFMSKMFNTAGLDPKANPAIQAALEDYGIDLDLSDDDEAHINDIEQPESFPDAEEVDDTNNNGATID
jgi:hypothetical protein